jgi:hypothetical protein
MLRDEATAFISSAKVRFSDIVANFKTEKILVQIEDANQKGGLAKEIDITQAV